jgi:glycosyltransferase involved in cell wall biosynthesis
VRISFCLITLNEEEALPRCLRSCAGLADEIVIVDSGSTDGTERLALEWGARFVPQAWLGYVAQKNQALSLARHDWVFSLDADEELSAALRAEIEALKRSDPPSSVSGFSMPRCVCYEGRWIRHGDWYPDRLTRLFRREGARFAGGRVHERLELDGEVRPLAGDLHHYSFRDAADHRARSEHYARLWAQDQFEAGKSAGALAPWLHGAFRWLRGFVVRGGFLDGAQGRRIAALCAREVFLKYRLLRALRQRRR